MLARVVWSSYCSTKVTIGGDYVESDSSYSSSTIGSKFIFPTKKLNKSRTKEVVSVRKKQNLRPNKFKTTT